MPEIIEVERLRRPLAAGMVGRTIVRVEENVSAGLSKHLRNSSLDEFLQLFQGVPIQRVGRVGKNLIFTTAGGDSLQWHLNSTGWFYPGNELAAQHYTDPLYKAFINFTSEKHPHRFALELDDGQRWLYRDQRTWGRGYLWRTHDVLDGTAGDLHKYGKDWLNDRLTAMQALRKWRPQSPRKLKDVVLDQTITTGVGNWIINEACYAARLHPLLPWSQVTDQQKLALCTAITDIIAEGMEAPDYGYWKVFDRKGQWCLRPDCNGVIEYVKDNPTSMRGNYYCPHCQPLA